MISKCLRCLKHSISKRRDSKWQIHLQSFCNSNLGKLLWCQLFLDNLELIIQYPSLSKQLEFEIRNTNISSQIIKIINQHYNSQGCIFKFSIELFGSYVKLKYSDVINPSKVTIKRLAQDYQQFVGFIKDLFVIFYGLQDREILGQQLFYKSTLANLAIGYLFGNEDFNSTLLKVIRGCLRDSIDKINFNIHKNSNFTLQDCGVNQKYLLNQLTLKYFSLKPNSTLSDNPFAGSIQIIKQICRVNSPIEKNILIENLQKQIHLNIVHFYKNHKIPTQNIDLDQQNLTAIFQYILIQANQTNLIIHIEIANYFSLSRSSSKSSTLNTLLSSLQLLQKGFAKGGNRRNIEFIDMQLYSLDQKKYFDEVSTFDL